MISADSRYSDSTIVTVLKNGNPVVVITPSQATSYTFSYKTYTTVAHDRVDLIAAAFYGDPNDWFTIADANPEILDWSSLQPGTILRIPSAQ